jgi:voltage-gated potassium channel
LGYAIIAVPTGIVSVELAQAKRRLEESLRCGSCGLSDHKDDARFCRRCGKEL